MTETTQQDLERAADEVTDSATPEEKASEEIVPQTQGEEQQETIETEETHEEPIDHGEKSRLGRKVKGIEDRLNQMMGKLEMLISNPSQTRVPEGQVDDSDEIAPGTKGELYAEFDKWTKQRESQQTEKDQEYQQVYVRKLTELGWDMLEAEYDEIVKELHANHNIRRTGEPEVDAELNFEKAQNAIFRKTLGKKKVPVKGEKLTGPLGGPSNTTITERAPASVKLDADAASFAEYLGWDDKKTREALSKDRLVGSKFPNIEEA